MWYWVDVKNRTHTSAHLLCITKIRVMWYWVNVKNNTHTWPQFLFISSVLNSIVNEWSRGAFLIKTCPTSVLISLVSTSSSQPLHTKHSLWILKKYCCNLSERFEIQDRWHALLIGWNIFDSCSRITAWQVTNLVKNDTLGQFLIQDGWLVFHHILSQITEHNCIPNHQSWQICFFWGLKNSCCFS